MSDNKLTELGAIWAKKSNNGVTFYSGKVTVGNETVEIVMFPNKFKNAPNHPDWRIYLSNPRPNQAQPNQAPKNVNRAPVRRQAGPSTRPNQSQPQPVEETDQPTL